MPTQATIDNALACLPHLVHAAQQRQTLTYGQLAAKIGAPHHRPSRHWLAYIRDEICAPRQLPLLTAIVVKQDDDLPGDDFLAEGTEHLSPEAYRAAFEKHRDVVFRYQGWNTLLDDFGLKPVAVTPEHLNSEARLYNKVAAQGAGGEADDHRQLKEYVAAHPTFFGLYVQDTIQEYTFITLDRCDVVFDLGSQGSAVMEIKNGDRGELVKGIYQTVKYRALLAAEKGHGDAYPVQAHLIAYTIPADIAAYAAKFDIHCHTIPRERVQAWVAANDHKA